MELNEKIQELRKQKGLTQEELAQILHVSRAAISKWESGRGYPNIDSLKTIAKYFSVTVDELLSSEELLTLAEADTRQREIRFCDLLFGLLDICVTSFLFLPFFGQTENGLVKAVSLLQLTEGARYLRLAYYLFVIGSVGFGIVTLALQTCQKICWVQNKGKISILFSMAGTLLMMISSQPYAAIFLFIFCVIKVLFLIKRK